MKYTNAEFGRELSAQLDRGYDPIRIARWAWQQFTDPDRRERSDELRSALLDLVTMEEGTEFHIPETDLRSMARRFMASDGR